MRGDLASAIGVTRLGRLTGLDRLGVEVACAVRPAGHVLQVANGKGGSWAAARRAALGEAAELWAAERVVPEELHYGTPAGMRARFGAASVWDGDLGSAGRCVVPGLWGERTFCAFREGGHLLTGERVFAPAGALHCPPPGSPPIGPRLWRWTSNGMGAHARRKRALRHALLEAVERDQLARALPEGWTAEELRARALVPGTLPEVLRRWRRRLAGAGLSLVLFDLTPTPGLGVPVAGALLLEVDAHAPVPLTAGYACRFDPTEALLAAFFEAAQSRLTDIHGAREDVEPMDARGLRRLRAWVAETVPRRSFGALPAPRRADTGWLLRALARAGHHRLAAFELAPPGLGLSVVKVVVPSLVRSELL